MSSSAGTMQTVSWLPSTALAATVKTREQQYGTDHRMGRIPVFRMKEVQALAEDLSFVVPLDSETLPGVNRAQAPVQP